MSKRSWWIWAQALFLDRAGAPDMLDLLECGLRYKRATGKFVRPAANDAVAELHAIVWEKILPDRPDGDGDDTDDVDDLFTTVERLARMAGRDPSYVRRLCRKRVLQSHKVSGVHYIERDSAERWLRSLSR